MTRLEARTRIPSIAATLGVVAVGALPASAAVGGPVATGFGIERVGGWAKQTGAKERRRARGPVVPVVGRVDYGTAENAFGAARSGHTHAGQDMFAAPGTAVVAVTDAVVAEVGSDGGQGNYVHLYDRRRDRTYVYMHLVEPAKVRAGERVEAGELLGGVGCTGSCWGDHLHFEVRDGRGYEGRPHDPMPLLKHWRSLEQPR